MVVVVEDGEVVEVMLLQRVLEEVPREVEVHIVWDLLDWERSYDEVVRGSVHGDVFSRLLSLKWFPSIYTQ